MQKYISTFAAYSTINFVVMPRRQPTPEERALKDQFDALLKAASKKSEDSIDVDRALTLFEKAQKTIAQAIAVLRGEEVVEDLEPGKKRAGRPKKVIEPADGELFQGDSSALAESEGVPATPTIKKKKGASAAA